ncbi:hypothetical protein EPUL_005013, partial [Erysiphe pulchra]
MYGAIEFHDYIQVTNDRTILREFVYSLQQILYSDSSLFQDRAILASRNDAVERFNDEVAEIRNTVLRDYFPLDEVRTEEFTNSTDYTPEYLQQITGQGLAAGILMLQVGMPVMLIRNFYSKLGLCNGSRLIITHLLNRAIKGRIISQDPCFGGKEYIISRASITSGEDFPFTMTAKGMWLKLKLQYEGSGEVLEHSAIQDYVRQTILDHPDLESYVNYFQKSCERLITLDLLDVSKWHPTMFVMGSIADLTDEARESSHERNTELAMFAQEKNFSTANVAEKKNNKKWTDLKTKKAKQKARKDLSSSLKGVSSDDNEPSSFVGMATTDSTLICSSNSTILPVSLDSAFISSTESFRWVIDTGADRHICKDLDTFDTYLPSNSLPMIGTANGQTRPLGVGTVTIRCKLSSGKTRKLKLREVLYLPQCPLNLFSGRKLYAQGGYMGNQGS